MIQFGGIQMSTFLFGQEVYNNFFLQFIFLRSGHKWTTAATQWTITQPPPFRAGCTIQFTRARPPRTRSFLTTDLIISATDSFAQTDF
jgi:hypothetical protein